MKCPRCVHENRATAKFCEACATPLNTVSPDRPNAPSYAELNSALSEALEQQMATGEVLQIISRSPTDLQPVLDTVVKSAARFCGADDAIIFQLEGAHLRLAAHYGPVPARVGVLLRVAPDTVVARAVLERRAVHTSDVQSDPEEYPETSAVARKLGYRTQLSVPLLREATAIGAVSLRRSDVNPFTDKQITLLQTFADQAVIAIENVRLFNELQTRNTELTEALDQQTATAEILRVISRSPTDVQPVFDAVAQNAATLCQAQFCHVFRFDGTLLHIAAHYGLPPEGLKALQSLYPAAPGQGSAAGRSLLSRHVEQIPDINADADYRHSGAAAIMNYRSIVAVPMLRDGMPVGCIVAGRSSTGSFPERLVRLLQTFADQAVIAIENVRLFNETKEALDQQTVTADILRVIASSPTELQPVLDAIATNATLVCDAYDAVVFLREGDHVRPAAHHGPITITVQHTTLSRGSITETAILDRQPVHVHDVLATEPRAFPLTAKAAREGGFRTVLAVPLLREHEAIGALAIRRREVQPFTPQQIALVQTFADQAVIAIENVRLFTELQASNRELTTALDKQTATGEILRVISSSPTDVQPVFDEIVLSAQRLLGARTSSVFRRLGDQIHLAAYTRTGDAADAAFASLFPMSFDDYRKHYPSAELDWVDGTVLHVSDFESGTHPQEFSQLARARGFRSLLQVPMRRGGHVIGLLRVTRPEPGAFANDEITLLETFADQAVIAIENVRLFTELQANNRALTQAHAQVSESLEQQTATAEILRVISSSPIDVQPVFDTIVERAARLCDAEVSLVARLEGDWIHVGAVYGTSVAGTDAVRRTYPMRPGAEGATARAIRDSAIAHIPDVLTDGEFTIRDAALAAGFRAVLAVPMLREGRAIGAISIGRAEAGEFSTEQVNLLRTFADQAIIAIENVRLFKELEARTQDLTRSVGELRALSEVGQAISSTLDLQTVLRTIVARATQLAGVDAGVIYEYDEQTEIFVPRATERLEVEIVETLIAAPVRKGEGATGRLAEAQAPIHLSDILEAPAESRVRETLGRAGYRALLAVPLVREGHLIGGLTVFRKAPGEFAPELIDLLQTFATQSGLAIQNARLFRELADKSRQLEAASQHKSEFLANMSHELRTPLNAIIGFSEVLSERMFGELNEKQDEYLKDIHASGQHLLSLINDILDLSKIEAGKMELELSDFDMPMTIENALMLVRERAARRGIELHRTVDERLGHIQADERKVRQVLLNLLSNAIKFTPEGGRIEVGAKAVNGLIEVSVTDTGVGIAPEDQEAVFEEFRQVGTADKKVEGTGLGLALSRKFIELHGGKIWVKSHVGAGSTFTFTVPVRRGE
jgi:GAF domain-containing protein